MVVDNQDTLTNLQFNFQVIEDFDAPNGKFANSFGNVVVIDSKYFIDELVEALRDNLSAISGGDILTSFLNSENLFETLDRLTINDYAIQVDVGEFNFFQK